MKLNKFKLFSYLGLGLATVATVGKLAGIVSPIVQVDPRIYAAGTTAEISLEVLDYGGNYLWNEEIRQETKYLRYGTEKVEFKKEGEFEEVQLTRYWK